MKIKFFFRTFKRMGARMSAGGLFYWRQWIFNFIMYRKGFWCQIFEKKIFRNIFLLTFVYFKWRKVLKENLKKFEILKAKESLTLPNEKLWPFSCYFSWNKSEYVVSSLRWLCVELYLLLLHQTLDICDTQRRTPRGDFFYLASVFF